MGFGDSVTLNCNKILEQVNKQCYRAFWMISSNIVMNTPSPEHPGQFAKGLLANQWYPMVGRGFSSELSTAISPNGSASLARINALVNSREFFGKDGAMTLTNNVSYARQANSVGWEAPQWSGRVGPYRMVEISFMKYKAENI